MSDKPKEDAKQPAKPAAAAPKPAPAPAAKPAAPATAAAAAKPAAAASAAKKPEVKLPDPVYNDSPSHPAYQGRSSGLLHGTRLWPTEVWKDPWAVDRYRWGAVKLAVIIGLLLGLGLGLGELVTGGLPRPGLGDLLYSLVARGSKFAAARCAHLGGREELLASGIWMLVKILVVVHVVALAPIFLVWWERKISAHMQSRFGPMYVGSFFNLNLHGWLQTIADGLKLLLKENVTPALSDKWVHRLAPAVVCAPALLAFAPVAFGRELAAADLDVGVLYVFAMAGVSVVGIMMAGWGSGNKYSLLGGLRSAAQLVSYEIPRTFSIVPVLMLAGSLNLSTIAAAQQDYWPLFLVAGPAVIPRWFIFYPVVGQLAFLIFLIASVAETNRVPFDIPEAESELVAGFHTEYGGMKFSLFFLAEYAYVLLACCLLASFFLGGGASPFFFDTWLPSWFWFLAKVLALVFLFLWFRWTFPRFRVDRLMDFNWKFLLPWTFANIALAGLFVLF